MKETEVFKALADDTRYKIIQDLLNNNNKCCTDFANLTGRDISTISRQLDILEKANLVEFTKVKKTKCVKIKNKKDVLALLKYSKKI